MQTNNKNNRFQSSLAPLMEQFIHEKRACGYKYHAEARLLASFDRFLSNEVMPPKELLQSTTEKWLAKQPHEKAITQHRRIFIVRQFAIFMSHQGYRVDVPGRSLGTKKDNVFLPRILTHTEISQLLQAVDQIPPNARSPLRHLIMPEVFRLLYGCGFRLNEVLNLHVADVDLNQGVLTVRQGKFGKDRLVPPALALVVRLQKYAADFGVRLSDALFFPSQHGGPWSIKTVYSLFRQLLLECGIPHAGRGKGPRVHDLRHYGAYSELGINAIHSPFTLYFTGIVRVQI